MWAFRGIDHPNRDEAIAAGFIRLQKVQLSGRFAHVNGPRIVTLE